MAANIKISPILKNLAKSAGYISADIFKSYAPTMSSLAETAKETATSGYQAIKDFNSSSSDSDGFSVKGFKNKAGEFIKNTWNNTIEDLKTGKIYNKERSEALGMEIASGVFGDFDFNFDLDDDWGDNDEDMSESDSTKAQISAQMQSTQAITASIDAMGRGLSASMTESTTKSASYIADSARENTLALINLNKQGFSSITKALMSVNETVYGFSKIGEPLTAHMQNSLLFFTETKQSLNEIKQSLKQIEKNTTPPEVAGNKGYKRTKSIADVISAGEGGRGIDFGELKNMVVETFNSYKDLLSLFGGMAKPVVNSGGKNVSALGMATKLGVESLFSNHLKSLKNLDESIKLALGAGLTKFSKMGTGNSLIDSILGVFIPKRDNKNDIKTDKYEKGPVQWDGVARKALIDVIPTTLLQIYSAITNTEPKRFNYNTGKFESAKSIKDEIIKKKKDYVERSGGDFYTAVMDNIKLYAYDNKKSKKDQEKMMLEAYKYFEKAFDTSDHRIFSQSHGIDEETYNLIKSVATNLQSKSSTRKFNNKWSIESNEMAINYSNYLREQETHGYNPYLMMHEELSGTGTSGKKGTKSTIIGLDEYGHNYYFYLQGIWQYTGYMAANFAKRKGRKGGGAEYIPDFNNSKPAIPKIKEAIKDSKDTEEEYNKRMIEYIRTKYKEDEEEDEVESNKKKIKDWFKKHISAPIRKKFNELVGNEDDADESQFFVVSIMNDISRTFDNLLWGTKDNPDKGIFSFMFEKTKNMFEKFKESTLDPLFDWFKDKFTKIKESAKGTIQKIIIGDKKDQNNSDTETATNNGQAAYGKKVTKTGIVTVSEGELIIPSEYNPFYHGPTNKAAQVNREKRISQGIFPMRSNGDPAFGEGFTMRDPTFGEKMKSKVQDAESKFKSKVSDNSFLGLLYRGIKWAFSGIKETVDDMTDKDKMEKDKKNAESKISTILEEASGSRVQIGAGLIIGAGASLFSGGLINPILGAALGAGVGLLSKSKKFQDIIFGPEEETTDKDGKKTVERKRQKLFDFFYKQFPSIAIAGGVGTVAGTFMGSPLAGAFIGSAIGFASKSDKFKQWLFGTEGKDGVISQDALNNLKKAAPAITLGATAAAGLGLGPLGLIPRILLGATIGYSASVGSLNKTLFGEKGNREGSVLWTIKEKIFGGINDIFHNLKNRFNVFFKGLGKSIKSLVLKGIDKWKNRKRKGRLTRAIGRLFGFGDDVLNKVVKKPIDWAGGIIDKFNTGLQKGNLEGGYSTYNRREKRNMTAAERIKARQKLGITKDKKMFNAFDKYLASIKDYDQLQNAKEQIRIIQTYPDDSDEYKAAVDTLMADPDFKAAMGENVTSKALSKLFGNKERIKTLIGDEEKGRKLGLEEQQRFHEEDNHKNIKTISEGVNQIVSEGITIKKDNDIESNESGETGDKKSGNILKNNENNEGSTDNEDAEDIEDEVTGVSSKAKGFFKGLRGSIVGGLRGIFGGNEKSKKFNWLRDAADKYGKEDEENSEENGEKKKGAVRYVSDFFGNLIKHKTNEQGEPVKDMQDSNTKAAAKKTNKFLNVINGMPSMFGSIMDGLFGKGDEEKGEKPGILTRLFSWFGDKFSKAKDFVMNTILPLAKSFLSNYLGPIATIVGGGYALFQLWFGDENGLFNKTINKLGEKIGFGRADAEDGGTVKSYQVDGKEVNKVKRTDAEGNETIVYKDAEGNEYSADQVTKSAVGSKTLTEKFRSADMRNILVGNHGSMTGKIMQAIAKALTKLGNALVKLPGIGPKLSAVKDKIVSGLQKLCEKVVGKMSQSTMQNIANQLDDLVLALKIAYMITDYTTGYQDAASILGIIHEPTKSQRIFCGIFKLAKNAIPLIGPMIPEDEMMSLLLKILDKVFDGLEDTMQDRENAKVEIEQYNREHGTNYQNAREFNKAVRHDTTWTEDYKNAWETAKERGKNGGSYIGGWVESMGDQKLRKQNKDYLRRHYKDMTYLQKEKCIYMGGFTAYEVQEFINEGIITPEDAQSLINKGYFQEGDLKFEPAKFTYGSAHSWTEIKNNFKVKTANVNKNLRLEKFKKYKKDLESGKFNEYEFLQWLNQTGNSSDKDAYNEFSTLFPTIPKEQIDAESKKYINKKIEQLNRQTKTNTAGKASGLVLDKANCLPCNAFQSQYDPRYSNIKFANSTIADAGCGPAVAAMASAMKGGSINMDKAIQEAAPYTNNDGTSVKYFEDKLGARKIDKPKYVQTALESGRPVILLGRDPSNKDKSKSPFGPNSHYVLAVGMNKGKVLVNDPESREPMIYDKSILSKSNYSMTYGGRSLLRGRGMEKGSVQDQLWAALKKNGFSDASAAGIMGNVQQESSMNPEADSGPAYGLFQFEKSAGNADRFYEFASNSGRAKNDPTAQLEFVMDKIAQEMETYSGNGEYTYDTGAKAWWPEKITLDKYKQLTDSDLATEIFERTYERASMPMMDQRKQYAREYLQLYQGTMGDASGSTSTTNNGNTWANIGQQIKSKAGILSQIKDVFGSLGSIYGKSGFQLGGSFGSAVNNAASSVGGSVSGAAGAQAAVEAARAKLGTEETGDNISEFGEWAGCNGLPWCAAFATWAVAQAFGGDKAKAIEALYGCSNTNYCPTLVDSFKGAGKWYSTPHVGDMVFYGDADHVGLVVDVNEANKTYTSIEGNWGNAVKMRPDLPWSGDPGDGRPIMGFGTPNYPATNSASALSSIKSSTSSLDSKYISTTGESALGSGLRGKSSGLLRKLAPSKYVYGSLKGQKLRAKSSGIKYNNRFRGAGSEAVTATLTKLKDNLTKVKKSGNYSGTGIDPTLVTDLLAAITKLLDSIANNTAPTQQIYTALTEYIEYVKGESDKNKSTNNYSSKNKVQMPTNNTEVDSNLSNLITTLSAIAAG